MSADANWSGQDVGLKPPLMPLIRGIISSAFLPSTRAAIPLRLPLQPPKKETFLTIQE